MLYVGNVDTTSNIFSCPRGNAKIFFMINSSVTPIPGPKTIIRINAAFAEPYKRRESQNFPPHKTPHLTVSLGLNHTLSRFNLHIFIDSEEILDATLPNFYWAGDGKTETSRLSRVFVRLERT